MWNIPIVIIFARIRVAFVSLARHMHAIIVSFVLRTSFLFAPSVCSYRLCVCERHSARIQTAYHWIWWLKTCGQLISFSFFVKFTQSFSRLLRACTSIFFSTLLVTIKWVCYSLTCTIFFSEIFIFRSYCIQNTSFFLSL